MNHMNEVAQMLGVELGEEFEIGGEYVTPFHLTERGLCNCCDRLVPFVLHNLITGNYEIVKKPWIPKDRELLWTLDGKGDNRELVTDTFYIDFAPDIAALALGWYFRDHEEAEAHADEIQEQMRRILAGELRAELVEAQK